MNKNWHGGTCGCPQSAAQRNLGDPEYGAVQGHLSKMCTLPSQLFINRNYNFAAIDYFFSDSSPQQLTPKLLLHYHHKATTNL